MSANLNFHDEPEPDEHDEAVRRIKLDALQKAAQQAGFMIPSKISNFIDLSLISVDEVGRTFGTVELIDEVRQEFPNMFNHKFTPPRGTPPPRQDPPLGGRSGPAPTSDPFEMAMRSMTYERM